MACELCRSVSGPVMAVFCCLGVKWLLCASDGAAAPDGEHGGGPLMAVAWII